MQAALPIIMLVLGSLGLACLIWVLMRALTDKSDPLAPPPQRKFVPRSNDEDVDRMVEALRANAVEHRGTAGPNQN